MAGILLIEDDADLASALVAALRKFGHRVRRAASGGEGLALLVPGCGFDLVLLDVMLPDLSGLEVCGRIRRTKGVGDIPVLMITARGDETDIVAGFRRGVDDYLVKPVRVKELGLRVEALLRRSGGGRPAGWQVGPFALDLDSRGLELDGRPLEVTPVEWRLLRELVAANASPCGREELLEKVWGDSGERGHRVVDVTVLRLRRKLGAHAGWLQTLRGRGYALRDPKG